MGHRILPQDNFLLLCDTQEAGVGAGRADRFEESGEGVTVIAERGKVGRWQDDKAAWQGSTQPT